VFGYIAVKDLSLLGDQVKLLARLGYSNKEIAIICDATPATVATLKLRHSKRRKRGNPKKK
jgi:DNA-binding CsgD family transcriptional regulator